MTITAKLIRETEVRTTDVMIGEATGETKTTCGSVRTVRLSLDGAPVMVTGRFGSYRYRPDMLVLVFHDGKLSNVKTFGYGIKKDGTTGKLAIDDSFSANGERRYYRDRDACPAEIMDIVRRYAA